MSLARLSPAPCPLQVLLLIDTAGCDFDEEADAESDSKRNEGEARAALAHAARLVEAGLAPEGIGIITPYCAQVALLREMRTTAAKGTLAAVEARAASRSIARAKC